MADIKEISGWAARKRAGGGLGGMGVPGTDGHQDPRPGDGHPGDDPADGGATEAPDYSGKSLEEHAVDLRAHAAALRDMDAIEGVDLNDFAERMDTLADELEEADQKADEAAGDDHDDQEGAEEGDDASTAA
jgi:hypothetical protein